MYKSICYITSSSTPVQAFTVNSCTAVDIISDNNTPGSTHPKQAQGLQSRQQYKALWAAAAGEQLSSIFSSLQSSGGSTTYACRGFQYFTREGSRKPECHYSCAAASSYHDNT